MIESLKNRARRPAAGMLVGLSLALILAGCATTPPPAPPAAPPVAAAPTPAPEKPPAVAAEPTAEQRAAEVARQRLSEAQQMYDHGDFNGTVRKLQWSPEIRTAPVAVRSRAYKLLAFSYCVTSRKTLCKQSFEELLKVDPSFELTEAEAGHPMWAPVFKQAQRDLERSATRKASPAPVVVAPPKTAAATLRN